jgi:hypothetical protein
MRWLEKLISWVPKLKIGRSVSAWELVGMGDLVSIAMPAKEAIF